jgi:hypothetical protein
MSKPKKGGKKSADDDFEEALADARRQDARVAEAEAEGKKRAEWMRECADYKEKRDKLIRNKCAQCNCSPAMMLCGVCRATSYCSGECQQLHHPSHSAFCAYAVAEGLGEELHRLKEMKGGGGGGQISLIINLDLIFLLINVT